MTAANGISPQEGDMQAINLDAFAEMTGFPVHLIKEELLLDSDSPKLGDLRKSLLNYLDDNFNQPE